MPVLKFETKLIDGKPNITFDTEKQKVATKRYGYKIKNQKYPLRLNQATDEMNAKISQSSYEPELFSQKKPQEVNRNRQRTSRNSTPEPILTNKTHLNLNNNSRQPKKPSTGKESLFNFLGKDENSKKIDRKSVEIEENYPRNRQPRRDSLSEADLDEIMKQVVMENRDLLSEEQLVDVLAKLYLDAKMMRQTVKPTEPKEIAERPTKERTFESIRREEPPKFDIRSLDNPTNHEIPKATNNSLSLAPLTAIQKKQLQWEKERKEMADIVSYNPWGKPGCGAPTKNPFETPKTETVYQARDSSQITRSRAYEPPVESYFPSERLTQSELKRQQWLTELNDQVAEKDRRKVLEKPLELTSSANPYLTSEQSPSHGRGKGLADLNQMSNEEIVLKRNKQLEQQEAIRKQIEEKELLKRIERETKVRLDQEEEARITREKQKIDTQYLSDTARLQQKEDESGKRLAHQRLQLEAAERAATLDKKLKRFQRLEMAGHDTKQLRAGFIAEQLSGRLGDSIELNSDDNSYNKQNFENVSDHRQANRSPRLHLRLPVTEDHGVQTDYNNERERRHMENHDNDRHRHYTSHRNRSIETEKEEKYHKSAIENTGRKQLRINSGKKRSNSAASMKHQLSRKIKKPEPIEARKPWGVKKAAKKYVPQSKRDPFYSTVQETRENHKQERVNRILAQVKANMDRIPDKDVNDGRLSQRHKRCDNRGEDHDKENYAINHDTYELKQSSDRVNSQFHYRDDDRPQATVTYKDSYKSPKTQTNRYLTEHQEQSRSPERFDDWYHDPDHEFVRTTDILNPAMADQRLPISRENTGRERARQGYYKNINPAQYGEPFDSKHDDYNQSHKDQNKYQQEPFYQPQSYPTQRQNTILKQLSEIKEGLRMKQKEIETSLSMNADM